MKRPALLSTLLVAAAAAACALSNGPDSPPQSGDGNINNSSPNPPSPPRPPDQVDDDSGALVGHRGHDGGAVGDAGPRPGRDSGPGDACTLPGCQGDAAGDDGGSDDGGNDAGGGDDGGNDAGPLLCPAPPGVGDLAVVELMIASRAGSGDQGEWLEVQSTQPSCTFNLNGLHVESPRGAASPDTLDVTTDLFLPPNGILVIADSLDPLTNNQLPSTPILLAWANDPSDVLKNGGDEVILSLNGTTIEDLTYPAFTLVDGTSISFPADCAWSDLPTWARWSFSSNFWYSTFQGTPNADNTDVTCF